jgi:hypothetical protein
MTAAKLIVGGSPEQPKFLKHQNQNGKEVDSPGSKLDFMPQRSWVE